MPRATLPRLHNSLLALVLSGGALALTLLASGPTAPIRSATADLTLEDRASIETSDVLPPGLPAQTPNLPALDARPVARRSRHALALPFFSFFPRG